MKKLRWLLRQILPLEYHSVYTVHGVRQQEVAGQIVDVPELHYTKWRMWLGRCFHVRDRILGPAA